MKSPAYLLMALLLAALLAACGGSEDKPSDSATEQEPEAVAQVEESAAEAESEPITSEDLSEPEPTAEPTEVPPTPTPEPTNTPEPTPTPEPFLSEPVLYSNGNYTRDVTLFGGKLWTAGSGGLTAYDLTTGEGRKYTHFDGLPNTSTYNFTTCPINGEERLIIGYHEGVLLYDAANDAWETGDVIGVDVDDRIFQIHCDAETGRLFLDYDDLMIVDLNSGSRVQLTDDDGALASFTFDNFFEVNGNVWASSYQGISIIAPDNSTTVLGEDQGTWPSDDITDAVMGPDGALWIAASEGIYYQTGDGLTPESFSLFDRDNAAGINYWGPEYIDFSADGQLWAAFSSELCQFDTTTGVCNQVFDITDDMGLDPDARIRGFEIAEDGSFLVRTTFYGAARYDGTAWTAYTLADQTPHNYFDDFYQTSDGKIWAMGWELVYTDVNAETWTRPEGIYADRMMEAEDGTLWFSTSNRLVKFDGQRMIEYTADDHGLLDESFNAMTIAANGDIYLGSWNGYSILGADGETVTVVSEEEGWDLGTIRALYTVGDIVYAGTGDGLAQLDGATFTSLVDDSYIAYGFNSTATLDALENGSESLGLAPGTLLMGTSEGLLYYDNGTLSVEEAVTGSVNDIFVDQATGEIYITARRNNDNDAGFYSYSPESGWSFMSDEEFPAESMLAVFKDEEGTVWVSSGDSTWGGGIVRMP